MASNPNPQQIGCKQWEDITIVDQITNVPPNSISSYTIRTIIKSVTNPAITLTIDTWTVVDATNNIFSYPISSNQTGVGLGPGTFIFNTFRTNTGAIADLTNGNFTIAPAPKPY